MIRSLSVLLVLNICQLIASSEVKVTQHPQAQLFETLVYTESPYARQDGVGVRYKLVNPKTNEFIEEITLHKTNEIVPYVQYIWQIKNGSHLTVLQLRNLMNSYRAYELQTEPHENDLE